jgi:hypothetical protein
VFTLGLASLRLEMDKIPLWRDDHVAIKQLVEDFGLYHYLPRLLCANVRVTMEIEADIPKRRARHRHREHPGAEVRPSGL